MMTNLGEETVASPEQSHPSTTLSSSSSSLRNKGAIRPFTDDDEKRIQGILDQTIEPEFIQFRPSAQGNVAYIEGWKALSLANEIFGFNGWSSEILSLSADFVDVTPDGRISVGISCMVRVRLRDGTFHEDIGYGIAENQKSKGSAWEKARKEAVTDAMKRALRMFGNRLGNCAYDKTFLRQVKNGTATKRPMMATIAPSGMNGTLSSSTSTTVVPVKDDIVALGKQPIPSDYAPTWKHPRSASLVKTADNPVNNSAIPAASEADSEPIVTEEQLLEFGSFFADGMSMEVSPVQSAMANSSYRQQGHHQAASPYMTYGTRRTSSATTSTTTTMANLPTVTMPLQQYRLPIPSAQNQKHP